ncbi:lysine N(6)-hydroxylase/L-ornithine N(5)-oxygenase family protein [Pseudoalteromonas rubra]|uniref:Ornithine monooxygenase n=1 Tax=Pseudoalteromonas rubra TaxID=43658 RepID=A0A0U3GRA2_9GAMM|nr:SidA/IucD/PvdA family monooxygenase [Pseudoalteromonas rubra]ALU41731.1 hypothetical protein AT705_01595 [Pseudoalteromonas rubra]
MQILDVVGVGFGPSNLALAIAIEEYNQSANTPLSMSFIERSAEFIWHKDMLIKDATIQVSFIKDLVTLRNPASEYSFLSYLKAQGRLLKFSNLKTFNPTRMEFCKYFRWAADKLPGVVQYSKRVIDVQPVGTESVNLWQVFYQHVESGEIESVFCRNLVIATGGTPKFPENIQPFPGKIWHSSGFLSNIAQFEHTGTPSFCVAGGGQSGAEIVEYLHANFPQATVHSVFGGFGYKPADESSFVNEIFDPDAVDVFYNVAAKRRDALLAELSQTNYNVVDIELIDKLYHIHYQEEVEGVPRLHFRRMTRVEDAKVTSNKVRVTLRDIHNDKAVTEHFDALIMATGYERASPHPLLDSLYGLIEFEQNKPIISRYFCVKTQAHVNARIILQGFSENAHGLTDTLLSTLSVRSEEILQNILDVPVNNESVTKPAATQDSAVKERNYEFI